MSKAFTRDDTSDEPVFVRPRAPLPDGVPNYVTPRGLEALKEELRALEREHHEASSRDGDEPRGADELAGRIADLGTRIATAEVVSPASVGHDTVHFGARVTVTSHAGERRYQIVGADEADAGHGKIAFFAPLARALLGKAAGDTVTVHTPRGDEELAIVAVDYDEVTAP